MTMILQRRINIDKKIIKLLLIGLLIRLLLMPFFTHWDLPATYEMAHYFGLHHIKDVYSVIYNNYNNWAADLPPLVFYTHGGYLALLKSIMPLFDVYPHFEFNSTFYPGWLHSVHAFRYLFLLKIPYLVFDILLAYILTLFFDDKNKKIQIFKLWFFCPISLYITYMFSQYDIVPAFLVTLSIFLFKKQKMNWSFSILGLAIAYKSYPIFFVLPALIICGGNIWKITKNLLLSILPYLLSILPFIKNISFRDTVLLNSRITSYFFKSGIPIGQGDNLVPFFIIYALIVIYFTVKKQENNEFNYKNLISSYTLILLSFFSLIYFHPQWLIWLMPLLTVYLVNNSKLYYIYGLIVILFIPYLFRFSSSTTWYLFDVINLDFFHYLKPPKQFIFQFYNADNFLHIFRSFLTGGLILMGIYIFKEKVKYR